MEIEKWAEWVGGGDSPRRRWAALVAGAGAHDLDSALGIFPEGLFKIFEVEGVRRI